MTDARRRNLDYMRQMMNQFKHGKRGKGRYKVTRVETLSSLLLDCERARKKSEFKEDGTGAGTRANVNIYKRTTSST